MRSAGIIVLHCDENGKVFSPNQNDWLIDLFTTSPLIGRAIQKKMPEWESQDSAIATEVFTGAWIAPVKLQQSKRESTVAVGLIITDELCDGEYFYALCQASSADVTVMRELIQSLPPVAKQDVQKMATLFQIAWDAHLENDESQKTIESFGQELADSYEEISLLYTMTSSMNTVNHPERFIELACTELLQTLPYEWIGVKLCIGKNLPSLGNAIVLASHGSQDEIEINKKTQDFFGNLQTTAAQIANGNDELSTQFGPATIVEPILKDGSTIGVLIAANKQGDDFTASSVDIKLISATATQLGKFLENALLYEDLNATFLGTLEALTTSIDAKDKYTCGHSQRVALLTSQLAQAYGLDSDQVERCRIAGLVHDIGKIGVPENVLLKQGGLTDDEFVTIQKHPEIGAHILRDIPQMEDILGGVLHHHEKYDGSGYPYGLSGNDIPLIARLISLADTFDAMSSSRTYRNAMTRQSVLEEMKVVSGTQFDPELAEVFFNLDFSLWEKMMIDHQERVPITMKDAA